MLMLFDHRIRPSTGGRNESELRIRIQLPATMGTPASVVGLVSDVALKRTQHLAEFSLEISAMQKAERTASVHLVQANVELH